MSKRFSPISKETQWDDFVNRILLRTQKSTATSFEKTFGNKFKFQNPNLQELYDKALEKSGENGTMPCPFHAPRISIAP